MFDGIDKTAVETVVYRLANPLRFRVSFMDLSTTLEDAIETIDFIGTDNADDAAAMLEMPFAQTPGYQPSPTRYSDGSWRVFYSALEPDTADAERGYWCLRELQSEPPQTRRFHYRELSCLFVGEIFDLRTKIETWPFLVGDQDDYPKCQEVARAAIADNIDGLYCPSARRATGTTVPVFFSRALTEPKILGAVIFEVSTDGSISITRP